MRVPSGPAREHIRMLRAAPYWMSYPRIAEVSGLAHSVIVRIVGGKLRDGRRVTVDEIHRDTEAIILGVRPELEHPGLGGRMPSIGAARRVRALLALGFSTQFVSENCGLGRHPNPAHRLARGLVRSEFIFRSTHQSVAEGYERLHATTPADWGISPNSYVRSRNSARRYGYPPPGCWDPDTIDDPDALPEWTGECGTERGYQIHYRERIPYCPPCREAHHEYKLEHPGKSPLKEQRWAEVRRLSEQRGMTVEQIAQELDISERTVTRALKEEEA